MGMSFRKKIPLTPKVDLNFSTSGVTVSVKPKGRRGRLTLNSKRGLRIRIVPGLSYQVTPKKLAGLAKKLV